VKNFNVGHGDHSAPGSRLLWCVRNLPVTVPRTVAGDDTYPLSVRSKANGSARDVRAEGNPLSISLMPYNWTLVK
jgi:hypothetical protein